MPQFRFRRIRFSKDADNRLKRLKALTGITPNILCRYAFAIALNEKGAAQNSKFNEDSTREIARGTLLGDYEQAAACLTQQWCELNDDLGQSIDDVYRALLHRGIDTLSSRVKSPGDLGGLL